jgi:hypothetical protein
MDAASLPSGDAIRHNVIDQQHQGIVAYTFQHPAEWHAESRLIWNYQQLFFPLIAFARAVSPQSPTMFEFLPGAQFTWTEPSYYQPGQDQAGLVHMPLMSVLDALTRLIIPKYRGHCQGLRIVGAEPVANLLQTINATEITQPQLYQGAMAHVEYVEQGRAIEEEFYGCQFQVPPLYGAGGAVYSWGLTRLFCFRAERGRLDACKQAFWQIASSVRFNPQWQQLCAQIMQQLGQQAQQNTQAGWNAIQAGWDRLSAAAQQSRQFIANNQAYIDRQQQRLQNDWHAQSHSTPSHSSGHTSSGEAEEYTSHEAFVDAIREEESIYNPNAPHNEKVSGYHDYIWTDEFGNVQATNDPNYDPNINSNQNWTRAQKKRIGD